MELIKLLTESYAAQGWTVFDVIPDELTYTPELILQKGNELKIFHIREDSSPVKETIIQRISYAKKIAGKTYEQYLVFPEKPNISTLNSCKIYRLGLMYLNAKKSFEDYAEPIKVAGRVKKSQIPNTKIFFSSKQDLEERKVAKNVIDIQKDANKIPVFANMVEDDQRYENNIDDIIDTINDVMDDSDFVLCILGEEHRDIVEQEVRRALDLYETEEIFLFLKNNKTSKEAWKGLLSHIHATSKVKYTEYNDVRDFEIKFTRRLMVVLKELHKKHDVEFLG